MTRLGRVRLRLEGSSLNPGKAKAAGSPQRLEEARQDPPQSLQSQHGPASTSISDFGPLELCENRLLWFQANQFVGLCYNSPRK